MILLIMSYLIIPLILIPIVPIYYYFYFYKNTTKKVMSFITDHDYKPKVSI